MLPGLSAGDRLVLLAGFKKFRLTIEPRRARRRHAARHDAEARISIAPISPSFLVAATRRASRYGDRYSALRPAYDFAFDAISRVSGGDAWAIRDSFAAPTIS